MKSFSPSIIVPAALAIIISSSSSTIIVDAQLATTTTRHNSNGKPKRRRLKVSAAKDPQMYLGLHPAQQSKLVRSRNHLETQKRRMTKSAKTTQAPPSRASAKTTPAPPSSGGKANKQTQNTVSVEIFKTKEAALDAGYDAYPVVNGTVQYMSLPLEQAELSSMSMFLDVAPAEDAVAAPDANSARADNTPSAAPSSKAAKGPKAVISQINKQEIDNSSTNMRSSTSCIGAVVTGALFMMW